MHGMSLLILCLSRTHMQACCQVNVHSLSTMHLANRTCSKCHVLGIYAVVWFAQYQTTTFAMCVCAAATPERIVRQKRFMGKLEKLYKVILIALVLSTVCSASFMLVLHAFQHFEHARHGVVHIQQQTCITCSDHLLCSTMPSHVLLKRQHSCLFCTAFLVPACFAENLYCA